MAVFKNGRIVGYTVYVIRFLTSKEMHRAEQRLVFSVGMKFFLGILLNQTLLRLISFGIR